MLDKIAKIANELDRRGLYDEADILTNVLNRLSSNDIFKNRLASDENKKPLNKPFRTPNGPKKFSVYVKDGDSVKKVNFGDPSMDIKRDNDSRRKNFRARHNCDNPGPKTKARYWSCKMWESGKSVGDVLKK